MTNRKTPVRDGPYSKLRLPNTHKHHSNNAGQANGCQPGLQNLGLAVRVFDGADSRETDGLSLEGWSLLSSPESCVLLVAHGPLSDMCQRRAWIGLTYRICPRIHRSSGASPSILFDWDPRLLHSSAPQPPYSPDLFVVETITTSFAGVNGNHHSSAALPIWRQSFIDSP